MIEPGKYNLLNEENNGQWNKNFYSSCIHDTQPVDYY
jgi:hypothetical protein